MLERDRGSSELARGNSERLLASLAAAKPSRFTCFFGRATACFSEVLQASAGAIARRMDEVHARLLRELDSYISFFKRR